NSLTGGTPNVIADNAANIHAGGNCVVSPLVQNRLEASPRTLAQVRTLDRNSFRSLTDFVRITAGFSALVSNGKTFAIDLAVVGTRARVMNRVRDLAVTVANALVARVEAASPPPPPPPVDVTIGTLPAGRSVTIVFDVTVNTPPVAQYSTQGMVTWTNSGSALTDDPAVGGLTDPTVTPGDRFNTSTALSSSLSPAFQGDSITFTAIVSPTEGSGLTPDGTVQFKDGVANLGSAATCVQDTAAHTCTAQLTTTTLATGTRS